MGGQSELKAWATEHMKGIENTLFPSFTLDMSDLDVDAVRWDVRQTIAHGFKATLCAPSGQRPEEFKRFVEVVVDEAGEDLMVSIPLEFDTMDLNFEMLRYAERVGCHSVLLGFPPSFRPTSEQEILDVTRQMCEATNLPVVLYATHKFNFERFHPSGFPPDLLARMAQIPNTVGIKVGILMADYVFEVLRRCGDDILVQCPWDRWVPMLVTEYGTQWMGAGPYEVFQSPEKPYLVRMFDLLLTGKTDDAMQIYWKLTPVRMTFEKQFMPSHGPAVYNVTQHKYYQWLVGGNGGVTRQPVMKMYQHEMEENKRALRAIGIEPRQPDEEFYPGRRNYARLEESRA